MIPTSITLTNFGPHRNTHVDFEGIHAAVFTGPNQAGKTLLGIDAPLWALYGITPKTRSADALVYVEQQSPRKPEQLGKGAGVSPGKGHGTFSARTRIGS